MNSHNQEETTDKNLLGEKNKHLNYRIYNASNRHITILREMRFNYQKEDVYKFLYNYYSLGKDFEQAIITQEKVENDLYTICSQYGISNLLFEKLNSLNNLFDELLKHSPYTISSSFSQEELTNVYDLIDKGTNYGKKEYLYSLDKLKMYSSPQVAFTNIAEYNEEDIRQWCYSFINLVSKYEDFLSKYRALVRDEERLEMPMVFKKIENFKVFDA